MAPKHAEIIREQPGGWAVAWDTNVVDPAVRRAFDQVIDANVRELRELLAGAGAPVDAPATSSRLRRSRA